MLSSSCYRLVFEGRISSQRQTTDSHLTSTPPIHAPPSKLLRPSIWISITLPSVPLFTLTLIHQLSRKPFPRSTSFGSTCWNFLCPTAHCICIRRPRRDLERNRPSFCRKAVLGLEIEELLNVINTAVPGRHCSILNSSSA
jgi:hypothetical protein